jgi:hypothetical protein
MEKIIVTEIRRARKPGALLGFADLRLGDVLIQDFRILKGSDGRLRVDPPQRAWKDDSGRLRFRSILTLPPALKQTVELTVLTMWREEMEETNQDGKLP